jgi:hypothetical protein
MTDTDRERFHELFTGLCLAFNKPLNAETAAAAGEFFAALADYPLSAVEAAKLRLVQSARFWPKVREWRQACDAVLAAKPTTFAPMTRELENGDLERLFHCRECEDSGWRPACGCRFGEIDLRGECPRHPRTEHGKVYRQAMTACACRNENPVYQANRPRVTGAAREAGTPREAA